MLNEHKLCPFCEGEGEFIGILGFDSYDMSFIRCKKCGATGPCRTDGDEVDTWDEWDRRPV